MHLFSSTMEAPHPRQRPASVFTWSSVREERRSRKVSLAIPAFLPGICRFLQCQTLPVQCSLCPVLQTDEDRVPVSESGLYVQSDGWIHSPVFRQESHQWRILVRSKDIASYKNIRFCSLVGHTVSACAVWFGRSSTFVSLRRSPQRIVCPMESSTCSHSTVMQAFSS